jgi:hypothetical protein
LVGTTELMPRIRATSCVLRRRAAVRSVAFMADRKAQQEGPAVSLGFGLFAILGLMFVTVIGATGYLWMGFLIGVIEVLVAWRVEPPAGARTLRIAAALMGATLLLWSVLRLVVR